MKAPTSSEKPVVLWRPSGVWHLKTLAVVYLVVIVGYVLVDRWLSRLPEPYRLRNVPAEMTPWLHR